METQAQKLVRISHHWSLSILSGNIKKQKVFRYFREVWTKISHCVKSVRVRSFSGPYFSAFNPNTGKYGPEKLQVLTLFTQRMGLSYA